MKKLAEVLSCQSDGTAQISLYKHQKCSGCGLCNRTVHPGSVIVAENPVNAGEGDMVSVELHKQFSMKPIIFKYIVNRGKNNFRYNSRRDWSCRDTLCLITVNTSNFFI